MRAGTQQCRELAGVVNGLRCFAVLGHLENPPFLPCPEVPVLPVRSPGCRCTAPVPALPWQGLAALHGSRAWRDGGGGTPAVPRNLLWCLQSPSCQDRSWGCLSLGGSDVAPSSPRATTSAAAAARQRWVSARTAPEQCQGIARAWPGHCRGRAGAELGQPLHRLLLQLLFPRSLPSSRKEEFLLGNIPTSQLRVFLGICSKGNSDLI